MRSNQDIRQAPCCWVLPTGQAQTFTSDTAGVLRVPSGRAWVTVSRPYLHHLVAVRPANADDDVFLDSKASLSLQAGQTVVLESWSVEPAAGVTVAWEVVLSSTSPQRWQQTVVQPARELAQGLAQAGNAFTKMLQGLFGYISLLQKNPDKLRCTTAD